VFAHKPRLASGLVYPCDRGRGGIAMDEARALRTLIEAIAKGETARALDLLAR
jgi:hypothetical protein